MVDIHQAFAPAGSTRFAATVDFQVKSFIRSKTARSRSSTDNMYNRSDPSSLADRISKTEIDADGDDNSVNIGILGFETPRKGLVV